MSKKKIAFAFLLLNILFFTSCDNKKEVDVSNIQADINIQRFEQDFFKVDTANIPAALQTLEAEYPIFLPLYMKNIMQFGWPLDSAGKNIKEVKLFLTNDAIQELYEETQKIFSNNEILEERLKDAVKHLKYYFPEIETPKIITFISEFAYANIKYEKGIAIGLDMYLGKDFKYYPSLGFPQFISRKLTPEYILPNTVQNILQDQYPEVEDHSKLIEKMVDQGKILYVMDYILPQVADSIKIGYTQEQMEWCRNNEAEMWTFFLKHDLLYSSEYMEIRKYITEAPTTPGMPHNSPGKVGVWMGWQIVKSYMDKNPDITLKQLMESEDNQQIFLTSGYRPNQ